MNRPLPPPVPGTAHTLTVDSATHRAGQMGTDSRRADSLARLPISAAIGAVVVLTTSLVASKFLLDAIIGQGWPVAVYVALLATIGYGPSLYWCWYACRRWGTGRLGVDIGLRPRWSDLGWGPVVWLAALAIQVVAALIITALGVPIEGNTEAISEGSVDRTYIVSIVITAVIAAPIVEEMVFRGVVLQGLRSRLPVVAAVALQGVLFGLAHVDPVRGAGNLGLVIVLSGVGIAFGVAAVLLRRIGASIVAHALFNGAVLLVVLSGVTDGLQSSAEEIGVVDQTNLTEPHGDRDPSAVTSAGIVLQPVQRS